jgi:hypothetical protein
MAYGTSWPIRSLVAEDRSAVGSRDQIGPETLVGPCWVRNRRANDGQQRTRPVTERQPEPLVTGRMASWPWTEKIGDVELASRQAAAASPAGSCPRGSSSPRTGRHPAVELGAVAASLEHHRPRRPCHPRAITSGHERSPADSYGHFEGAGGLGAHP